MQCILKHSYDELYTWRNKHKLKTYVFLLDKDDGTRTRCASESAEVLADAFSSEKRRNRLYDRSEEASLNVAMVCQNLKR